MRMRELKDFEMLCSVCDGDGRINKHLAFHFSNRCPKCNGTGIVDKPSVSFLIDIKHIQIPAFAKAMDEVLCKSDHKGGWLKVGILSKGRGNYEKADD